MDVQELLSEHGRLITVILVTITGVVGLTLVIYNADPTGTIHLLQAVVNVISDLVAKCIDYGIEIMRRISEIKVDFRLPHQQG